MSGREAGDPFGALGAHRRRGDERFRSRGRELPFELVDFWRWSASDLVSNATRGVLAEYLVAQALGLDLAGVRDEWAPVDLMTASGVRIEVKSAAYLQAWRQRGPSKPSFDIAPTRLSDPRPAGEREGTVRRADIYVFALLAHLDKRTLDPLDLDQWEFHLVPTSRLDELHPGQQRLGLAAVQRLAPRATFDELPARLAELERDLRRR